MRRPDVPSGGAAGGQVPVRFLRVGNLTKCSLPSHPSSLDSSPSSCPSRDEGLYPDDGGQAARLDVPKHCGRILEAEEGRQKPASSS